MPDWFLRDDFVDAGTREQILRAMIAAQGSAAGVYGRQHSDAVVEPNVRRARLVEVSPELRELVSGLLASAQETVSRHFGVAVSAFEEPQFLHYVAGDFFVAHQDGNTGMLRDDSVHRRISAVIFLNSTSMEPREGSYGGGSLVLHGAYPKYDERHVVPAAAGTLVAFRSEATHEVVPVTHGDRYTIVSWYRT